MINIAIDIDCVCNNLMDRAIEEYNKRYSKSISAEDLTSYDLYDCLNKEDADGIIELFKEKDLWESLTPLPGAKAGIKNLIDRGHKLLFVTATDSINFDWKVQWFKKFFPFINTDNIIRIMDKSLLKLDVIIDDCMDNLIKSFCDRICFDYPWNRSKSKDYAYSIYRCKNWDEIIEAMNEIEKEIKKYE